MDSNSNSSVGSPSAAFRRQQQQQQRSCSSSSSALIRNRKCFLAISALLFFVVVVPIWLSIVMLPQTLTYSDLPVWLAEFIDPGFVIYDRETFGSFPPHSSIAAKEEEETLLHIYTFRRNEHLHEQVMGDQQQNSKEDKSAFKNQFRRRSVFRIAIFTDLHFGEDAHLDALTAALQDRVLSPSSANKIDFVVHLGDMISQENYAASRIPVLQHQKQQTDNSNDEEVRGGNSDSGASSGLIPSCLRDRELGAKRCMRIAHDAAIRNGVPFATIFGNHDCNRPIVRDLKKKNNNNNGSITAAEESAVSMADMMKDLASYTVLETKNNRKRRQLFADNKNSDGANWRRKSRMECQNFVDSIDSSCTLLVPRLEKNSDESNKDDADDADAEDTESVRLQKQKSKFLVPSHLVLSFFNSIADDTDRVFLHGYKYPSQTQIQQFRGVTRQLAWLQKQQRETSARQDAAAAASATTESVKTRPPLHFAFVHVPPPVYRQRTGSLLAWAGSANETPSCAPPLKGPMDFSRALADSTVDIVVAGHDHFNDEWAVHDRRLGGSTPSPSSPSSVSAEPLHLVYGRHTGFGGYYDMHRENSARVPGVRLLEMFELSPHDFAAVLNEKMRQHMLALGAPKWTLRHLAEQRCSMQVKQAYSDMKLCRFNIAADDPIMQRQHDEVDSLFDAERGNNNNSSSKSKSKSGNQRLSIFFYSVVRSWIVTPILQGVESGNFEEGADERDKELLEREKKLKAHEPAERLLHTLLRRAHIVGLMADLQPLQTWDRSRSSSSDAIKQFGFDDDSSCDNEINYEFVARIVFFLIATLVVAPAVALVLWRCVRCGLQIAGYSGEDGPLFFSFSFSFFSKSDEETVKDHKVV